MNFHGIFGVVVVFLCSLSRLGAGARNVHSMFPRLNSIYSPGAASKLNDAPTTRNRFHWRTSSRQFTSQRRPPTNPVPKVPDNGRPVLQFNRRPERLKEVTDPVRTLDNADVRVTPRHNAAAFVSSSETVQIGDTAVLHCSFLLTAKRRHRNGHIAWFKGPHQSRQRPLAKGSRVYTRDRRIRVLTVPHSAVSVLLIERVQPSDGGKYRCSMRHASVPNQFVNLNVTRTPVKLRTPQFLHDRQYRRQDTQALELGPEKTDAKVDGGKDENGVRQLTQRPTQWINTPNTNVPPLPRDSPAASNAVSAGERIVEKCLSDDDFRYRVTWTGRHENGTRMLFDGGRDVYRGNELLIPAASSSRHSGVYTCAARDSKDAVKFSKNFKITIEDRPWPISIFVQGFNIDMMLDKLSRKPRFGRSVSFRCETGGRPQPKVTWYKNGVPLRRHRGELRLRTYSPSYRPNTVISKVVIRNFLPKDQGRYTCKSESTKGFRERSINIQGSYSSTG